MNVIALQNEMHNALFNSVRNRKSIPILHIGGEEPITVQSVEDGLVIHCNHAGAVYDAVSYDVVVRGIDGPDYAEITHAGLVCDKCPAWQSEDGEWHE